MGPCARHALLLVAAVAAVRHASARAETTVASVAGDPRPPSPSTLYDIRVYGAKGNGRDDDTSAIQAAIDAASAGQGTVTVPPAPGPYLFTRLVLKPGLRGVRGEGGILKILRSDESGNVVLAGKHDGFASNMSDCTVSGLIIDADRRACVTLRLNGATRCAIVDNVIRNQVLDSACPGGAAISVRAPNTGDQDASLNVISGNVVFAEEDTEPQGLGGRANHCIQLTGEPRYTAPYKDAPSQWKASFTNVDSKFHPVHNLVRNNVLIGGYYGVDLAMARENQVMDNTIIRPVRGISLQHSSTGNLVSNNRIIDSRSSGIHLAYGASQNSISGNFIQTDRSMNGEALLQAYLGSSQNTFTGNVVLLGGNGRTQYLAYSGPQSSDNVFIGNRLEGAPTRAGLAVESAWDSSTTSPASYAFHKAPAVVDSTADLDTGGVIVTGNVISVTGNRAVPAVYLGQTTDKRGRHALSRVVVAQNVLTRDGRQLELKEDTPGSLRDVTLRDNAFAAGATPSDFVLPRGRAHLRLRAGDDFDGANVYLPEGQTSPSVAVGGVFMFAPSRSPQRIVDFVGGSEGQEILVRLAPGATIVSDPKHIVCRGGANIVGTADDFVRFRRVGGVWFELSRNF